MKTFAACLLVSFSVFFISCQKSDKIDPTYTFKANIDGNWITLSQAKFSMTPNPSDPSQTNLVIFSGDNLNSMNISMSGYFDVANGLNYNTDGSSNSYTMNVNYYKNDGQLKTYGVAGPSTGDQPYYTVTITSYTDDEIKGTISGNFLYSGSEDHSVTFTEGEFVAKRNF